MSYVQRPLNSLKSFTIALTMIGLTIGVTSETHAQGSVPEYMPYQGFINDASGAPVNGAVSLTFKLYDELLSANPLWEESVANINVVSGAFALNLGEVTPNLRSYLYTGQARYIGVSVDGGPELSPRTQLGTLPYAFLSYNALRFDGRSVDDFVTQEQFTTYTATVVGGLNTDQVNTLIDARGYLNQAAITNLVNGLIDQRGYITEADVEARITEVTNQVNLQINTLQGRVTTLETNLTALQTTVAALQVTVNNVQNQGALPFILGVSAQSDDGWLQFTDSAGVEHQGVRAAGEMCKASYPDDAQAHFCSMGEVQAALSVGNYNANINNEETWIFPSWTKSNGGFEGDADFCQSLLYNSAHAATGTSVAILTAQNSTSGGSGARLVFNDNKSCNQSLAVLCCR